MEFKKFFDSLRKHRPVMIILPIAVMLLTFLLTKDKKSTYSSRARISAGLVDQTQKLFLDKDDQVENKINQSFSNLIQMLQLKTVFDQVSYELILNDLTTKTPFHKPSKLLLQLNSSARKHAVEVYTKMYNNRQPLSMADEDQRGLYKVLVSMQYDFDGLKKNYHVYRVENSDFIDLEFESENPLLSAFVINAISREFISYYTSLTKQNELKALNFVTDLLKVKKDSLDAKTANLMNYKIQNRILNLNEQTRSLYSQLSEMDTRLKVAQSVVGANTGAIETINSKFDQNDKQYIESKMSLVNRDIVTLREKLNRANDDYIKSNFDNAIKVKIDSLRGKLAQKINQSTDRYITNPLATKENLVAQKLKLEIDLSLAQNSIKSLSEESEKIHSRLDSLVPNEAVIQSMEADINVASQEYIEILKRYNQVSEEFNSAIRLKQIEIGQPGDPQPSKKIILIVVSGVVVFVIYFIVLFILSYLDSSITLVTELESNVLEITQLWKADLDNPIEKEFRTLLRNTRFELQLSLKNGNVVAVTGLKKGVGKTLFCLSMAYAYQMVGKKVLLIDGNFLNPEISKIASPEFFLEDYFSGEISFQNSIDGDKLRILGNKGGEHTLFEIHNEGYIRQVLDELKSIFDIVIIETSSLDTLNDAKEWFELSDGVVSIFEANNAINHGMELQIEYLRSLGPKFVGWVLNRVTASDFKVTESKKAL
jgi:polysaccharide biosynthesis transport protein